MFPSELRTRCQVIANLAPMALCVISAADSLISAPRTPCAFRRHRAFSTFLHGDECKGFCCSMLDRIRRICSGRQSRPRVARGHAALCQRGKFDRLDSLATHWFPDQHPALMPLSLTTTGRWGASKSRSLRNNLVFHHHRDHRATLLTGWIGASSPSSNFF